MNGEIYRAKNCTSNEKNLDLALKNLEIIFLNNEYPKNLIKNKINEIKGRNFGENPNKALRLAEENDPEIKFFISVSLSRASDVDVLLQICKIF